MSLTVVVLERKLAETLVGILAESWTLVETVDAVLIASFLMVSIDWKMKVSLFLKEVVFERGSFY